SRVHRSFVARGTAATAAPAPPTARRTPRVAPAPLGASAAAAREDDVVRDDVGRVPLLAVLLVARGLDAPLDEDAVALGQELRERFAAFAPHGHAVPFGALLARVRTVEVALGRREPELEHGLPSRRDTKLGIRPEISEQEHPVQPFGHACLLLRERGRMAWLAPPVNGRLQGFALRR